MKNSISCPSCRTANPFYQLNCTNCKAYLRERVYNLDLWKLLEILIENPIKAFTRIIYSEQKNFIISIILLVSIKLFIVSIFFSLLKQESSITISLIPNYLTILLITLFDLVLTTFLLKVSTNKLKIQTRFADVLSVLSYSLIPNIFGVIILFPLELIFFGGYLFSNNPSPFIINPFPAYTLLTLELLLILWSIFLAISAVFTLSRTWIYSIFCGFFFSIIIYGTVYLSSILFLY
ncbi:MAG: hypothetical protein HXY50_15060 [Ignavibacteriaceae bacterium]|nr:hypothetical protein [Ignavibacteriaceae bacterium]